ncbi:hypothetical protein EAKF1_ch1424c [Escherichia albertii KF1]|nr:hypothetical protein EAKF1_ch1424c [Escherichia albertii KF1]
MHLYDFVSRIRRSRHSERGTAIKNGAKKRRFLDGGKAD